MTSSIDDTRTTWQDDVVSWALSFVLHAVLIVLMAMIGWTIVQYDPPAAVIELGDADAPDSGFASGRSGSQDSTAADASSASASSAAAITLPAPPIAALEALPTDANTPEEPSLDDALQTSATVFGALDAIAPLGGTDSGDGAAGKLDGTSDGFQNALAGMRGQGLDVVFVLDATSSMDPYILQAKNRLQQIIELINGLIGKDVEGAKRPRFGLVAFKDFGDAYGLEAVRVAPLTSEAAEIQDFIDQVNSNGGGDIPEPIHVALAAANHNSMGWRKGRKAVIVLIGDAPVHLLKQREAINEARSFARRRNGTINAIDVGGAGGGQRTRNSVLEDFDLISQAGNGSAFLLKDEVDFWQHMIVSIFGKQYERDVQQIIEKFIVE